MKKLFIILFTLTFVFGCTKDECVINEKQISDVKITGLYNSTIVFNELDDISHNLSVLDNNPLYSDSFSFKGVKIKDIYNKNNIGDFNYLKVVGEDEFIVYTKNNISDESYLITMINDVLLDKPIFYKKGVLNIYSVNNVSELCFLDEWLGE